MATTYSQWEIKYRAWESRGGGVIELQPMRAQMQGMEEFRGRSHIRPTVNERADKGHGKVQGRSHRPIDNERADTGQEKVQGEETWTYSQ